MSSGPGLSRSLFAQSLRFQHKDGGFCTRKDVAFSGTIGILPEPHAVLSLSKSLADTTVGHLSRFSFAGSSFPSSFPRTQHWQFIFPIIPAFLSPSRASFYRSAVVYPEQDRSYILSPCIWVRLPRFGMGKLAAHLARCSLARLLTKRRQVLILLNTSELGTGLRRLLPPCVPPPNTGHSVLLACWSSPSPTLSFLQMK